MPVPDVSLQPVVAVDPSGTSEPSDKSDIKMMPKNDEIGTIASLARIKVASTCLNESVGRAGGKRRRPPPAPFTSAQPAHARVARTGPALAPIDEKAEPAAAVVIHNPTADSGLLDSTHDAQAPPFSVCTVG
jgi:hypothetical protein